jgi:hypothetical protein
MKLVFEIKTEPVTQAGIIVAIIAFSSSSLALIVTYSESPLVSISVQSFLLLLFIWPSASLPAEIDVQDKCSHG